MSEQKKKVTKKKVVKKVSKPAKEKVFLGNCVKTGKPLYKEI